MTTVIGSSPQAVSASQVDTFGQTDGFGCPLSKLSGDDQFVSSNISFHRKASATQALGRVTMDASDRGFLIGISLLAGHTRRIIHGNTSREYHFGENSIYLRNLDEDYKADIAGSFDFALLELSKEGLDEIAGNSDLRMQSDLAEKTAKSDAVLGGLTRALFAAKNRAATPRNLLHEQLSSAIGLHVLLTYGRHSAVTRKSRLSLSNVQEARAKDYLTATRDGQESLDYVASACGMSRVAFIRSFKATTGMTPHDWLTGYRVDKARMMILQSKRDLRDIAEDCGFASMTRFERAFAELLGVDPAAIRKGGN